jgi:acyl-CoA thioester hydrolase
MTHAPGDDGKGHQGRHRYDCHVRFSDVDVYGHVNNVKYFEYYQEARVAFLMSLVASRDPSADLSSSTGQVVARIDVDYRRPLLFRPDPYVVETWVTRVGRSSFDLDCRIVDLPADGPADGSTDRATVYSTASVRLVAFDTAGQRSRPLTPHERSLLEGAPAPQES